MPDLCKRGHDREVVGKIGRGCRQCHRDFNREVQRRARATPEGYRKDRVRSKVNHAIEAGKLTKGEACEECGARGRLEAHHDSYDRPLDIAWLCKKCHVGRHRTAA